MHATNVPQRTHKVIDAVQSQHRQWTGKHTLLPNKVFKLRQIHNNYLVHGPFSTSYVFALINGCILSYFFK